MVWLPYHWIKKQPLERNFSQRYFHTKPNTIVIHYTAGGFYQGSIDWFNDRRARASAHFVIARNGLVIQLLDCKHKAWHAGDGEIMHGGEMHPDPNLFSIGIELANFGLLIEQDNNFFYSYDGIKKYQYPVKKYGMPEFGKLAFKRGPVIEGYWEPYKKEQIEVLKSLLTSLKEIYKIKDERIVGHEDIALPLGKKKDPGPLFPWDKIVSKKSSLTRIL